MRHLNEVRTGVATVGDVIATAPCVIFIVPTQKFDAQVPPKTQ
jgi:hypothetical protein